jgi:hypothetical protein
VADGAAAFHRIFAVDVARKTVRLRAAVPAADGPAIPPPLRAHYTRHPELVAPDLLALPAPPAAAVGGASAAAASSGATAAAASSGATDAADASPGSGWLHLRPDAGRLFRSASPLATCAVAVWMSRGKVGVMASEDDTATMMRHLQAAGYATHLPPLLTKLQAQLQRAAAAAARAGGAAGKAKPAAAADAAAPAPAAASAEAST